MRSIRGMMSVNIFFTHGGMWWVAGELDEQSEALLKPLTLVYKLRADYRK